MSKANHEGAADPNLSRPRRRLMLKAGAAGVFYAALPRTVSAASSGTIKIGLLGPFTGPASRTGEETRNGGGERKVVYPLEYADAELQLPPEL